MTDIGIMKQLGMQNFRFSIAWPRIYPQGSGQVNQEGLNFYHKVLDALNEAGITPHVTLYHWDLPQVLIFSLLAQLLSILGNLVAIACYLAQWTCLLG